MGSFLKLHEAFNEFQNSLVVKIHPKIFLPQYEPPMLNTIDRLLNILSRTPVDVNLIFIFK